MASHARCPGPPDGAPPPGAHSKVIRLVKAAKRVVEAAGRFSRSPGVHPDEMGRAHDTRVLAAGRRG